MDTEQYRILITNIYFHCDSPYISYFELKGLTPLTRVPISNKIEDLIWKLEKLLNRDTKYDQNEEWCSVCSCDDCEGSGCSYCIAEFDSNVEVIFDQKFYCSRIRTYDKDCPAIYNYKDVEYEYLNLAFRELEEWFKTNNVKYVKQGKIRCPQ